MDVLDVLYAVTCVVLVGAGAAKSAAPGATTRALDGLGLPGGDTSSRVLGGAEMVAGLAGLLTHWRAAAVVVALLHLGFAAVVLAAVRAGLPDCGCVGVREREPTVAHAATNLAAAGVAGVVAARGPVALPDGLEAVGWPASLLVVLAVVAGSAAVLAR